MIFASRKSRKGKDPHLETKIGIFFLGGAVGLVGIGLESSLLVGLAILILALGMATRFLPGPGGPSREDQEDGEENGPDPGPH